MNVICAGRRLPGGEKLTNDFDGETHDYTHKGGVVHTEILLPSHAPSQYTDRAVLWNAVEKIEKAKSIHFTTFGYSKNKL